MAPYPEEIDVFSAPHSRMKQLVDVYSEKLTCTDFSDYVALESLLHDLHHTFCEFKSHEQIENKYIMRKLKKRLKSLSIHDAAVCNCHSDNKLSDMLALVEDGYSCTSKPEADRINFGIKLQNALQEFTGSFLPHMKEEEEVFQPMLMKYFEYEELKCLKEQVIEEHSKWHVYDTEKHFLEEAEADLKIDAGTSDLKDSISCLPPEILSHILSFLSPQDRLRCSGVCHLWYDIAHGPSLWKEIYPCFWGHGIWENYDDNHEDRIEKFYSDSIGSARRYRDEDADIDEYEEAEYFSSEDDYSEHYIEKYQKEIKSLDSIIKYLLPLVGTGVQKIVLSSCRSLTSKQLRSILIQCPNVAYLDISYTTILDSAFKGLKEYSCCLYLQHLDMSGCKAVTNLGLFRLADCMAMLPPHVPNASHNLRDVYLEDCQRYQNRFLPCENPNDCFCEIEESGLWLQRSSPCYQCRANEFCTSVCFWQKNGVMCHLAKLSLQCPFMNCSEQFQMQSGPALYSSGASSILKTTGTLVNDSSSNELPHASCDARSLKYLNLSGCKKITDEGLRCLLEAGILSALEVLDVSGCSQLTGPGLRFVTDSLKSLQPENIFYCDQILDGPYPETANGCQNLESRFRACCCRMLS